MKRLLLFLLLFTVYCLPIIGLHAQNLVPNPSFEEYTVCPNNYYMLPNDWYTCSGDPDYFNACDSIGNIDFSVPQNSFGYQHAFDGKAYCGFYSLSFTATPPYKEYIGCHLLTPLIIGQKYFISFYISYVEGAGIKMATNNIGLLFSTISYQDYQPYDTIWGIPTNNFAHVLDTNIITDSQNWSIIRGSIIADSAYQYILIGNFFDIAHTDTLLYNNPIWLQQHAYYFLDKVCVSTDSLTCNSSDEIHEVILDNSEVNIFPNPAYNKVNIIWSLNPTEYVYYTIYDSSGKLVENIENNKNILSIDVIGLSKGIYFLKISNNNKFYSTKLIIN